MAQLRISIADGGAGIREGGRLNPGGGTISPGGGVRPLGGGQVAVGAGMLPAPPDLPLNDPRLAAAGGNAIRAAAGEVVDLAAAEQRANEAVQLTTARARASERLSELANELGRDASIQDTATARERWAQAAAAVQRELRDTLPRGAAQAFDASFIETSSVRRLGFEREVQERANQTRVASLNDALDVHARAAAAARSPLEREAEVGRAVAAIDQVVAAGGLNPLQAQQLRNRFGQQVDTADVLRLINTAPAQAARNLAEGRYRFLDPVQTERLSEQARNEVERNSRRAEAEMARREAAATRVVQSIDQLLAQGIVPAARIAEAEALARGTPLAPVVARLVDDARAVERFMVAPPADQARMLEEADQRRRRPDATDADQGYFARLATVQRNVREAYTRDGVGASVALGLVPPLPPVNWTDAATLVPRVEAAQGESRRLGMPISPFTQADIAAGVEAYAAASPEGQAAIRATVNAIPDPAIRERVMREMERTRGDYGGQPRGSMPWLAALDRMGIAETTVAARRLTADLSSPADARVAQAAERPELRTALESELGRGALAVLQQQAAISGDPEVMGSLNTALAMAREAAARRMARGMSPTEAVRSAVSDVMAGRQPLRVDGLAELMIPARSVPPAELVPGLRTLRARAGQAPMDPAAGAGANAMARERRAAASRAVWVNSGDGFALMVPGSPAPLARASLDEVLAAGRATQTAPPPVMQREQQLEQQRREQRRLPPAPTVELR
jgi:hypothetical protein